MGYPTSGTGGGRFRPIRRGQPVGYAGETIWVYKKEDLIFQDGAGTWRFADSGKALTKQEAKGIPGNKQKVKDTYFDKGAGVWRERTTNKIVPYTAGQVGQDENLTYKPHAGTVKKTQYDGLKQERTTGKVEFSKQPLDAKGKEIKKEVRRREAETRRRALDGDKAVREAKERRRDHERFLDNQKAQGITDANERKQQIRDAHNRFLEQKADERRALIGEKKKRTTRYETLLEERRRLRRELTAENRQQVNRRLRKLNKELKEAKSWGDLLDPRTGKLPDLPPGAPF